MKYGLNLFIAKYNNTKEYYVNKQLHREDGPAIEYASGTKAWYINGQKHRINGPAVEYASGSKLWYLNDILHKLDRPACEWSDDVKSWYIKNINVSYIKCIFPIYKEYNLKLITLNHLKKI